MIYSDLPAGAIVFVDAGPFIHHFEPNPLFGTASTQFRARIENQEIDGVTTTHVVSEVAHRLMPLEAMQMFFNLASSDSDFDRVAAITRYAPI